MKNKFVELNNFLFAQLERLDVEQLSAEDIEKEVKRTDAIVAVSEQLIRNGDLAVKAASLVANHGDRFQNMMPMMIASKTVEEAKK